LIGGTSFPAITTVQEVDDPENWIALGVRLLAVNGELLPSADILEDFLMGQFGTQEPASVDVKVRIQRSNSTTIEEVPLSLDFVQSLTLNTGLEVTFSEDNGRSVATITNLPVSTRADIMLGDQIIKDTVTDTLLSDIRSFETFVENLNGDNAATPRFEILRKGEALTVDAAL